MWTRRRTTAIVIVALASIVTTAGTAQEPNAIGIVRADGLLMPIALITGKTFDGPPGKPDLEGRVWSLADGNETPVTITTLDEQLTRMPYCDDRYLWRTTLKRPPAPEGVAPIPKLGAAVSGAQFEFPENVTHLPDAGSQRVGHRIASLFLSREKARLAQESGPYAVSAPPNAGPVQIKQLQRHVLGASSTYYFEATRPLRLSDGAIDPDAGLVTGWIVDSPAGLRDYEVTYKVNDDAAKQTDRAVVRGILRYQGRALWLLEWHGWESEYYTLREWPSGIQQVSVGAYEC